jgi:hypothetical protein
MMDKKVTSRGATWRTARGAVLSRLGAALVVGLVVIVVGCSGSSSGGDLVGRVCSTSVPLAEDMYSAFQRADQLKPASGVEARNDLLRHTLAGKEIASRYKMEIEAIPIPDTQAGREAEGFLNIAVADAKDTFTQQERQILRLPTSIAIAQSMRQLDSLKLAFVRVIYTMIIAPTNIAEFVPDMRPEFESSASCDELAAIGE